MRKVGSIALGLALAGCAAEAAITDEYKSALECELTVGTLAAFDKSLPEAKLVKYQHYYRAAVERTESLGEKIGKVPQEVDRDRRAFLTRLVEMPAKEGFALSHRIAESCLAPTD